MMAAIRAGGSTPFNRVKAAAVFIFAETSSIDHLPAQSREWAGSNPDRRLALLRSIDVTGAVVRAQREHIVRELKGSRLVTIPGARHLIFMSNPREFEKIMKEFLAGL
jgi:pimeloyl-ACP methyl ester carboxylesterase